MRISAIVLGTVALASAPGCARSALPDPVIVAPRADDLLEARLQEAALRPIRVWVSTDALPPASPPRVSGPPGPSRLPSLRPSEASRADLWPIVAIEPTRLLVDGAPQGDPQEVIRRGRGQVARLDDLFDALKVRRAGWRDQHLKAEFPGLVGFRVDPGTPAVVLKSALQTAAFAGFPFSFLQSSAEPSRLFAVDTDVPIPPGPGPSRWGGSVLHIYVRERGYDVRWTVHGTKVSESAVTGANLAAALCTEWKAQGLHRDPEDDERDDLALHADDAAAIKSVLDALEAMETCVRPLRAREGDTHDVAAFRATLTIW